MDKAGLDQTDLANAVGLRQPSIGRLLSGETKSTRKVSEIARALNVSPEYLCGWVASPDIAGDTDKAEPYFRLPQVRVGRLSASTSLPAAEAEGASVPFPRDWLQALMTRGFGDLFVVTQEGMEMVPTLLDGDHALVDAAVREISDQDRLWCLAYGGIGMVRRIRRLPDGRLRIFGDSPASAPIDAADQECDLIGRVIWIGRRV